MAAPDDRLTSRMTGRRNGLRSGLVVPGILAGVTSLLHVVTSSDSWGIFRDELYYWACSNHLDFGYVDHPPFVAVMTRLARALLGDSLPALRLFPALAAGGTVFLTALIARRMDGGPFARALAGLVAALTPVYIANFGYLSMNAYDVLLWTAVAWCAVSLIDSDDPRWWLAFGAAAGIGLQNKISMLFLGFGIVVGLLLSSGVRPFLNRWFWLGGAIAAGIFLPHVLWQIRNDWPTPEFVRNATQDKNLPISPGEFLFEQVMLMGPVVAVIALAGLAFCLLPGAGRRWRPLGLAFVVVATILILQRGKPYYLSPGYTMLFAAGSVALERIAGGRWRWLRPVALVLVVAAGAALAPLAKPLLPIETHVGYTRMLGVAPGTDERKEVGRVSQFFADRIGWRELAALVAQVHAALPEADRGRACVYGQNYGQAGAIDYFRAEMDLPPAISGHNSYWLWGTAGCTGEVIIIIGGEREDHEESFASVEQAAVHACGDCMPYEDDKPIFVARDLRVPIEEAWSRTKHYD